MFMSCRDHIPPLSDNSTPVYPETQVSWVQDAMVGVAHLNPACTGDGAGPLQPQYAHARPLTEETARMQESNALHTSASASQQEDDAQSHDALPPFCASDPDSPEANKHFSTSHGMTTLHRACREGDIEAAKKLVAARTDPSIRDDHWYCALHYAAEGGHAALIDIIVCEGLAEAEAETEAKAEAEAGISQASYWKCKHN